MWYLNLVTKYVYLQGTFHSTTHWLQACGIFLKIKDDIIREKSVVPLAKMGIAEPLTNEQLLMLFIVLGIGLSLAIIAFVGDIRDIIQNINSFTERG